MQWKITENQMKIKSEKNKKQVYYYLKLLILRGI